MKKYFLILGFFIFLAIVFMAVGADKLPQFRFDFSKNDVEVDETESILDSSAQGTIKSLGALTISDSGTHILQKNDGGTLLLIGLRINLDSYIDQNLIVHGRMTLTSGGKELLQVLSVDKPETEYSTRQVSNDPSWSLFSDGHFGISFKKRGNWNQTIDRDKIVFEFPAPDKDFIVIERFKKSESPTQDPKLQSVKNKIGVDLLSSDKIVYADGRIDFKLERNSFFYFLSYRPDEKKAGDPHQNDFFQLLATFRFIPFYE